MGGISIRYAGTTGTLPLRVNLLFPGLLISGVGLNGLLCLCIHRGQRGNCGQDVHFRAEEYPATPGGVRTEASQTNSDPSQL